jgi:arylsulfatase A-like enzyme
VREARLGIYASITFLDEQIGRILDSLKKHNLHENTLVLFTSTNGEMAGDQHMWGTSYPYEASARIPMVLRWPESLLKGAKRGQVLSQPVELRDVAPTLLDAAGLPIPSAVEGRSLLDLVQGKSEGWREHIDLEHCIHVWRRNNWNALTDGKWKYIFEAYDGTQQLFHLAEDPHELRDLASDPKHAAEVQKWRKRLIAHLSVRDERWVKDGELVLRKERLMTGPNFPGGERGKFFDQ